MCIFSPVPDCVQHYPTILEVSRYMTQIRMPEINWWFMTANNVEVIV